MRTRLESQSPHARETWVVGCGLGCTPAHVGLASNTPSSSNSRPGVHPSLAPVDRHHPPGIAAISFVLSPQRC